ncbi:AraC family transcriptional regulator ligand-binding domain-containing protein [Streptomyces fimicarius]|uniref:AraC family transcriptional regulator ligand-binding domain-containing protein n=1 Tax=Streptomyces griseus TaxID=1911 RepID=UPI0036E370C8
MPPEALASEDGLIPITSHDLMLDTVARELRCPDFGLRLACAQDLSILGRLALAVQASSTVSEALACASRFMFVHSPVLSVGVEPDPRGRREVVALTYRKDLRESPYSPQAMELGLGLFHQVASALVGGTAGRRTAPEGSGVTDRYGDCPGPSPASGAPGVSRCGCRSPYRGRP